MRAKGANLVGFVFIVEAMVSVYHVYQNIWDTIVDEELTLESLPWRECMALVGGNIALFCSLGMFVNVVPLIIFLCSHVQCPCVVGDDFGK